MVRIVWRSVDGEESRSSDGSESTHRTRRASSQRNRDFRLALPEVDPQALLDDEQARERYETAVRDAVRHESGWEVLSDAVLGQFSFQKLAMYDD